MVVTLADKGGKGRVGRWEEEVRWEGRGRGGKAGREARAE